MNVKDQFKEASVFDLPSVVWLITTVVISLLGLAIHNLQEFGLQGMIALDLGMIPMLVLQITILLVWKFYPQRRKTMTRWLLFCALLHLVIGAFLTIFPLSIFPFEPAQTINHYIAHLIYGLLQLPLILTTLRLLRHI